jgi:choline/glycine/proline betaine transport protein
MERLEMSDEDDRIGAGPHVELFHAKTDRKPGDNNIQALGFDIHPEVFFISSALVVVFIALTLPLQEQAATVFGAILWTTADYAGWFYVLATNVFAVFVVAIAFSKHGSVRIGGVEARKGFSNFSWMAMLFSAGMGIGLVFWSVAEPITHFGTLPGLFGAESGTTAAAEGALAFTFFHWSLPHSG